MLVLTRRLDEKVTLEWKDKKIELIVLKFQGNQVRLGIEADKDVHIFRNELREDLTVK